MGRSHVGCCFVLATAFAGCRGTESETPIAKSELRSGAPLEENPQAVRTGPWAFQTRAEIATWLSSPPTEILPVGDHHTLVVWNFHLRWSELEASEVYLVALEDAHSRIAWWCRVPCVPAGLDRCAQVVEPLLSADRTPSERESVLREHGLLGG